MLYVLLKPPGRQQLIARGLVEFERTADLVETWGSEFRLFDRIRKKLFYGYFLGDVRDLPNYLGTTDFKLELKEDRDGTWHPFLWRPRNESD